MGINDVLLVGAALVPAIALCVYVYKKDRREKEPLWLLILLLAVGIFAIIPSIYAELFLDMVINAFFNNGENLSPLMSNVYKAVQMFVGVALVEEGFKLLGLYLATKRLKEFDSFFDGFLYAIFVSLGFAGMENVFYVTEYGWMNALTRGVFSVPAHAFFAVFMGYYYSMANITDKAIQLEEELYKTGIIDGALKPLSSRGLWAKAFWVPVVLHGLYDYFCVAGGIWGSIALDLFMLGMYFYCFSKIKKMSMADESNSRYAFAVVRDRYKL